MKRFLLIIAVVMVGVVLSFAQNNSPLCFTARNGSVAVIFSIKNVTHTIQYSRDGLNWDTYTYGISINANQSVYFRAETNQTIATAFGDKDLSDCSRFYFSSSNGGKVEGSGNIMSLYGPDCPNLPLNQYAFSCLFSGCTSLTTAPSLPATTLADSCYYYMFHGTSLVTAPSLPATTLADGCYNSMFYVCNSLVTAPSLPATTLADGCYRLMFKNCTSLVTAPSLPATTLAKCCYANMFDGCTSLATAPSLSATALADSCYYFMFSGCKSFATAPSLPATTLAPYCYSGMFTGCSSLTTAPSLPATTLAPYCYSSMFADCSSLATAPSLPATTLASRCYSGMFFGCSSLATAPSLPVTTLADGCYSAMFSFCTSLVSAPSLPATTLANDCYRYMFRECTSLVSAPSLPATSLADYCYEYMFWCCNSLIVNTTAPGKPWKIPATTTATSALYGMFTMTGGTMNGTPSLNTTYYIASDTTGYYNVLATSNDSTMGTVTGSGRYLEGDTVTITATANSGCHFVSWSNGKTTPTINVIVTEDTAFVANFAIDQHIVTAVPNDTTMGSVTGAGIYDYGTNVTLTATPIEHHYFVNWSNGETTAAINVAVTKDTTLVANFAANPTYLIADSHTMCNGESYTWRTKTLTAAGIYYDSLKTILGEDSVYKLTLTVNPIYFYEESHAICQGGTYNWHNKALTAAGVYYDSLLTGLGCDSVYELTLTVNPTYFYEESHAICQGETYNWHSKALTAAGVYYDSLLTGLGCDSVYELTLTVNPTYFYEESHAICQGGTYNWHNKALTAAGVYYDSLVTRLGCDSVYELTLSVNPTYFYEESHAICQGGTYNWHNKALTAAGVYYDSLLTGLGCDSVYELTLTVNPTYFYEESHAICQGETYNWHSKALTAAGVYYDSLVTRLGCDSVYELTLVVNQRCFIRESDHICHGEQYNWHNKTLTTAGVYYDSLYTRTGCDSVYELTLTYSEYTVALDVNDDMMGYVDGAGVYECGDTATITAVANEHYKFVSWDNGKTKATLTFIVTQDVSLEATFEAMVYNVVASANYTNMGTVTGSGQYSYLAKVPLTATPNQGYEFKGWSNGETAATFFLTVESDTIVTAIFAAVSTGVDDADDVEYVVYTEGRGIVVKGASSLCIVDAAGRVVYDGKVEDEMARFEVAVAGVYFVRCDGKEMVKVVVR